MKLKAAQCCASLQTIVTRS